MEVKILAKVKVLDALMGTGKTHYFINKMNNDTDDENRYIYITPFLSEVDRVVSSCTEKKFSQPKNVGNGKLDDLHRRLSRRENIVSTHALFTAFNDVTKGLIELGGYILILDEVFEVIRPIDITKKDMNILLNESNLIRVKDNSYVEWIDDEYEGEFEWIKGIAKTDNLVYVNDKQFLWMFPYQIFDAFKEVYIATFMFDAQVQKYYYDMHGIEFEYIDFSKRSVPSFKDKIHILDADSVNKIGHKRHALSVSWFVANKEFVGVLKRNIYNVFNNYFKSYNNKSNMWTTFKRNESALSGRSYGKSFVEFNSRSTNKYRNKRYLAYCVNVFFNPNIKNFFIKNGVDVKEDEYALSEMLQWIWRSAIRDGEDIWIYIPSSRMRGLLKDWIEGWSD